MKHSLWCDVRWNDGNRPIAVSVLFQTTLVTFYLLRDHRGETIKLEMCVCVCERDWTSNNTTVVVVVKDHSHTDCLQLAMRTLPTQHRTRLHCRGLDGGLGGWMSGWMSGAVHRWQTLLVGGDALNHWGIGDWHWMAWILSHFNHFNLVHFNQANPLVKRSTGQNNFFPTMVYMTRWSMNESTVSLATLAHTRTLHTKE